VVEASHHKGHQGTQRKTQRKERGFKSFFVFFFVSLGALCGEIPIDKKRKTAYNVFVMNMNSFTESKYESVVSH
jgi:hypothetical protein